jgi:hypothetical protein
VSRSRSTAPPEIDALDGTFALLFLVFAAWSIAGLTLAEAGRFHPFPLAAAGSAGTIVACAAGWSTRDRSRPAPRAHVASLVLCILAAASLFGRPGEYFIEGGDGSVYLNIGNALARTGTLRPVEPLLEEIDTLGPDGGPARGALLREERGWLTVADLFPGGVQAVQRDARVQPNFFHLLPVWIGILTLAGGPGAGIWAPVAAGVLAVAALWLLARRIMPLAGANIAAALSVANFGQIWFARVPTSEGLTAFLLLAGLGFVASCAGRPSRVTGASAGVAFGLAACTRIDVLALVTPFVALWLIGRALDRQWHRGWTAMAAALSITTAQAVAHAIVIARAYTLRIVYFAVHSPTLGAWGLAIPLCAVAAGAAFWWWAARRPAGSAWRRRLQIAGLALVALVVAWRLGPAFTHGYLFMLLTPLGLALALGGLVAVGARDRSGVGLLLAGLFLVSALLYGESVRDRTLMPMLFRRFVPVVLPIGLLFAGAACAWIAARRTWWRWAGWAAPLVLAVLFLARSAPILARPAMQDVTRQIAAFADGLPHGALVITDASTPSHLGLSLHDTFGVSVLFVQPSAGTSAALGDLVARMAAAGRPVVLAAGMGEPQRGELTTADLDRVSLEPLSTWTFRLTALESTSDRFPAAHVTAAPAVAVYRVGPRRAMPLPLRIDIGDYDAGVITSGLHGAETMGAVRARWTTGTTVITLPSTAPFEGAAVLRVRLAAPTPLDVPPPRVTMELDGEPLGVSPPIPRTFVDVEMPVPPSLAAGMHQRPTRLTLMAPAFVPREHGAGDDGRQLGVAIDSIMLGPQ